MAVNKVVVNTENGAVTLIDLTGDTVTPEKLAKGATAHDASGKQIVGTHIDPTPVYETWVFEMADGTTIEKVVNVSD